ncbi:phospholipase A and acyltransferase 2-like isoform X1 [Branchiostoma floridae]|uniref:Phospholipase A and acyltransferase 2-like isoform X1 n=2 Tax=Branchiostoma floridae TaxID=7739 RepID=A0A9J7MVU2_BRAFL|nr:phospholipase A and acyltransferase 2-like isoform X1 [Branchiostoma floridae]
MLNQTVAGDIRTMGDRHLKPSLELAEQVQAQPGDKLSYRTWSRSDNDLSEHHVIYVGNGQVVHYNDDQHIVVKAWLSQVTAGGRTEPVNLKGTFVTYSQAEVVTRAERLVGHSYRYDLMFSNCQNFANWCQTGKEQTGGTQVMTYIMGLGTVAVVVFILHHFLK